MYKKFLIAFLLFTTNCFSQNDCIDAIIACGNSDYSGLTASGYGRQEIDSTSSCGSRESNSIWLKLSIKNSGTLAFVITPESNSILEDFDFFLFGPNFSCGTIEAPIRCSTTNPYAINASNNLTGMNDTETDEHEGPAYDGNSYVKSLDVNAGEIYYLAVDRPVGDSNFSITWTGTATFNDTPVSQAVSTASLNLTNCLNEFNLDQNTPLILGNQTNVAVTYHTNQNDALTGSNPILNSSNFPSTQNPQLIFAKLTNTFTGCASNINFTIAVESIAIPYDSFSKCDDLSDGDDENGYTTFDMNEVTASIMQGQDLTGKTVAYFNSRANALSNFSPFTLSYTNSIAGQENIFIKVTALNGCFEIKEITLTVLPVPAKVNAVLTQCDSGVNPDGLTLFDLMEALPLLTNNDPNLSAEFLVNGNIIPLEYSNIINPQVISVKITDATTQCSSFSTLTLNVNTLPGQIISIDAQCDILNIENGFREFNLNNSSLVLGIGETASFYKTLNDALLKTNEITNIANYTNETTYEQTIFVRVGNATSCAGISELFLKVHPLPKLGPDYSDYICTNLPQDYITLSPGLLSGNSNDFDYEWSTGQISQTIRTNLAGIYSVKVTSKDGCETTRIITVLPSNDATIKNIDIIDNSENNTVTIHIEASSLGEYLYSIDAPSGPFQASNHFENISPGFHKIYVYDTKGCGTVSEEISILRLPKFFTPNGDNYNDTWDIVGMSPKFYANAKIHVFDRFGKLVADINPLSNGWNGIHNGQPLPSSDYWYVLKLDNGRTIKGHFSLVR